MKANSNNPDCVIRENNHRRKNGSARTSLRKTKSTVYPKLNDFMYLHSIATINEYGEKVISGRRIC